MYKRNVKVLSLFNFLIGFSLFAPLAIIYFSQVSGSYVLGTSVFGIIMLSSAIFEVPTGTWSDKVGRKTTIILGTIARLIAFSLYATGLSYWWLVAGAIMEGMSRSFYSGNNEALLYDSLADEQKQESYAEFQGKVSSTEQLAMGISAILSGLIIFFPFSYLLWFSVFVQGLMLVICYWLIEPGHHPGKEANIYAHIKEAFLLFVTNKKLRLLSLASILSYSIGELKWEFNSAFVASVWPAWAIGIARTIPSFGSSISFYFSGKLIRKFKALKILLAGNIYGKAVNLVALSFPSVISPFIMSTTSFLHGVRSIAQSTLMQNEFTNHQRATMSSLNSLGGSVLYFVFSLLLGGLADLWGPARALIVLTIISAPAIWIYWILFKRDRDLRLS